MASKAQQAANRRNAQKSTGPVSDAGKAKSSMNALTLGLSSADGRVVLPTESSEEFDLFEEALLADIKPVGALEERRAAEVVGYLWRLRRIAKIEFGVLVHGVADADERFLNGRKRKFEVSEMEALRIKAGVKDPDAIFAVANEPVHEFLAGLIDEAIEARRTDEVRLASGFIETADTLAKLGRYETMLSRRMHQALSALHELQAKRLQETEERD